MEPWRLIIDPPRPAGYNMAVDEVLAESCRIGVAGPTFRIYAWDRPSVSLGYFQQPAEVADLDRCRAAGIPVVMRTTGGRAVYHDDEVTYSVAAPVPDPRFPPTIKGTFAVVAKAFAAGLAELGVHTEFASGFRPPDRHRSPLCFDSAGWYEITLDGRKLIGSAQRRWKTAFLQHGSIILTYDPNRAVLWLRNPEPAPLQSLPWGLNASGRTWTRHQVHQALVRGWETCGVEFHTGSLTTWETRRVAQSSAERNLAKTAETDRHAQCR